MFDPVVIGPQHDKHRSRPLLRTMLGDVLRRTRLEQGRTLADVAGAARVSMPYLSEVEREARLVRPEAVRAARAPGLPRGGEATCLLAA